MIAALFFGVSGCATTAPSRPPGEAGRPVLSEAPPRPRPKILVIMSSARLLTLRAGDIHPTGYFLNELAVPLRAIVDAGYDPVFADPSGNPPQPDPASDSARYFGYDETRRLGAKAFLDSLDGLKHPKSFYDLLRDGLQDFAGVFVPGGHAPMEDLPSSAELGRILRTFHDTGRPTALICHGPVALLSTMPDPAEYASRLATHRRVAFRKRRGGFEPWPYAGYHMTVFSSAEEKSAEERVLGGRVRYFPEAALAQAGARVSVASPGQSSVVVDRELVTGQNPMSDAELAAKFLELLKKAR